MILVDTSIWIELIAGRFAPPLERDLVQFVTCGPILQEVLQGIRPGAAGGALRESLLAFPIISDPMPARLFVRAAEIYSEGRRRGITVRSPVDCLIAAVAIENDALVWHNDRDFTAIARYTALQARR